MCFVLFIVCLYICVCECLFEANNHKTKHKINTTSIQHSYVQGPLREYCSIRSGASGLPYYCAPLVCISAVIGLLAVWPHHKPKTKNQKPSLVIPKPPHRTRGDPLKEWGRRAHRWGTGGRLYRKTTPPRGGLSLVSQVRCHDSKLTSSYRASKCSKTSTTMTLSAPHRAV